MMDADIPDESIHEANTWVPVANNIGYVAGISAAAPLLNHTGTATVRAVISLVALLVVAYSVIQLTATGRRPRPATAASDEMTTQSRVGG